MEKLLPIRVGALYMEMGTGKTRTALEIISRRHAAGKIDAVLWLCPCSVRESLKKDLLFHADGVLSVVAVYGIETLSSSVRIFDLLDRFVSLKRVMLVVDESNLVKNHEAIRTTRITALAQKCRYRMILNGTPISRNEADLFAQWYILDWRILGYRSFWKFAANHLEYDPEIPGKVRRTLNVDVLVEKISPYCYQVSKSDCWQLPGKNYHEVSCRLSSDQEEHYEAVVSEMIDRIDERQPQTIYRMFSAAQAVISGLHVADDGKHLRTSPMFADPMENPRIRKLVDLVEGLPDGCQAIVFAKYSHEIRSLLRVLPSAVPFYGALSATEREKSLAAFRDGSARFLVANKTCAGYGLNLQFCRTVIYYSNDFDWATRAQSEDRVYRIGQTQSVDIYDIVARDTLDQMILRCLSRKERLEDVLKTQIRRHNSLTEARGKYHKWLRGEMEDDGEAVS